MSAIRSNSITSKVLDVLLGQDWMTREEAYAKLSRKYGSDGMISDQQLSKCLSEIKRLHRRGYRLLETKDGKRKLFKIREYVSDSLLDS